MNRSDQPLFWEAVEKLKTSPLPTDPANDGRGHARAHNFIYDERVPEARERAYHHHLALASASAETLRQRHNNYIEERLHTTSIPPTFLPENSGALIESLAAGQDLVRIEIIDDLLKGMVGEEAGVTDLESAFKLFESQFNVYRQAIAGQLQHRNAQDFLQDWLEEWNDNMRDSRPAFAAFEDEVADLIEKGDWAPLMRSRLGLAHVKPDAKGNAPYIALMKYSSAEVMAAFRSMSKLGARAPFAIPTVLDSRIWEYFFPAPIDPNRSHGESYGRAMPLEPAAEEGELLAELLHVKLDYKPGHIQKLFRMDTDIPTFTVRELRNTHLDVLRMESERYDFGESIP